MADIIEDLNDLDAPKAVASAPKIRTGALLSQLLLMGVVVLGTVFEHGFYQAPVNVYLIHIIQGVCLAAYWIIFFYRSWSGTLPMPGQKITWSDFVVLAFIALGACMHMAGVFEPYGWYLLEIGGVLLFFGELWRINVALSRKLSRPGLLFPLSFVMMIVVGAALLKMPVAVPQGQHISWIDSFFTMTSAVCVTGLSVRNTAAGFTPFGQAIICLFIQMGGLGIIIFGSMLALLLGRSLSLRENMNLSSMLADQPMFRLSSFVRFIVLTTFAIEACGAIAMYPLWHSSGLAPLTASDRIAYSIFHSVSAFCNAGFSITGSNFTTYRYTIISQLIIPLLIVLGGLGFLVHSNLLQVAQHKIVRLFRRPNIKLRRVNLIQTRLSLHTKLVLTTTLGLYLFGVVTIAAGQLMPYVYSGSDAGHEAVQVSGQAASQAANQGSLTFKKFGEVLADASFLSVDSRTSGFTTFDLNHLQAAGTFSIMALMAVGGSPASTAGGIGTTVFALLLLSVWAALKQDRKIQIFGRSISEALVRRAAALAICYVALIFVSTFLLCLTEHFPFDKILFEVISASSTVGLSLGITPHLSTFGKTVIIISMYLGRIGPLALMGALVLRSGYRSLCSYPHEHVALG